MQEKLTDNRTPTSSRASSFFIENLLGTGRNKQDSASDSSQGDAGGQSVSNSRLLNAPQADTNVPVPDGSSPTARSPYRDSPLQWYGGGNAAFNSRALETPHSEFRVDFMLNENK